MKAERTRDIALLLLGVAAMLFFRHVGGSLAPFARAHGANLSVSYGAFFLLRLFRLPGNERPLATAGYTLALVWLAEAAQRLGWYPGTYDSLDLLYDAIGVTLALGMHVLLARPGPGRRA